MCSKQKSLNFGKFVPDDKVLNKKVPENPKYKHVKPAIDTGKNIRKHIDDLKEKQKGCNHKRDEVFKRIKVSTFVKLALAVAIDSKSETDIVNTSSSADATKPPESSSRRCAANVLMGIGELDVLKERRNHSTTVKPTKNLPPYLLLDVRDQDAFSRCHIVTAKHYPYTMLSRVCYETEDMKQFKNSQYRLIVLYDDDESIATRVATTLVERGYENIHLLTGGLKLALEICPKGLTTSSQKTPVHMLTQNVNIQTQRIGKENFSQEDIDIIQSYIDMYPNRGNNRVWSSPFSQSNGKTGSSRSCMTSTSRASATSSRHSTCCSSTAEQKYQQSTGSTTSKLSHTHPNSPKTTKQVHFKSTMDSKARQPKKAPWK